MKRIIKKILHSKGLEIRNLNSISGYEQALVELYPKLYAADSLLHKRFYNIGAGGFEHPYWTNVDYDSEWYADNREKTLRGIPYDLLAIQPLPIASNSAEIVYSSHTVEHITNESAQNMFNESYRILKPDGFFRLTMPNIDLDYRAYQDNDRDYFYWYFRKHRAPIYHEPLEQGSIEQFFLCHFATSVSTLVINGADARIDDRQFKQLLHDMKYEQAMNYCTAQCPLEVQRHNPGYHINWWNYRKTERMLKQAGFSRIYVSAFGQSACPVLREIRILIIRNRKYRCMLRRANR